MKGEKEERGVERMSCAKPVNNLINEVNKLQIFSTNILIYIIIDR